MKKVITIVLAVLIVVGGGGYLLATQADAAEPGDTLYSIDLLAENIQRLITFDELKRAELETMILDERISELDNVYTSDMDLTEVLSAITEQQDRVREHIGTLEANPEMYQDGQLEQIRNRYEEQLQQNIQVMEKVQNQGEDSALQIKQQLEEDLQNCQSGNCNVKEDGTAGNSENGNSSDDSGNQGGNEDAGNGSDNGNSGTSGNSQGGNPNN